MASQKQISSKERSAQFKGLVEVYTGDGKGKTTAALGLAFRAAGHGFRSYIGQFLKGQPSGELQTAKKLQPLITIEQFGRQKFIKVTEDFEEEDYRLAEEGLKKCLEAMLGGQYQIVILDEINVALNLGLIKEEEMQKFLDQKPEAVEIVLTGRYAPRSIIDRADLVTEMVCRKHYYDKGVRARKGIEK
ncbi:MAG TPA: cob(I)yrinic acid a,c-diamide adenosyltransferase [Candidatus Saccharicenans sp.]|jgi:cob(I)alamin adenosyltransferase|nr:cob(I)yrinic acid a,c-diamide adenosyltransferase [Candidatus Saccharicenans sp.]HOP61482.1 cob(I)yrinic acid a,c-diamide adenosyltransferase [Candidatus Saccharicenans sp.]HPU93503.1 cob(I)yrinic acid a,c-diamide adenosyltransferase [Candidatus Saccharicenans sp.]HQM74248.1 cob(I)yrinic acid a,c-diamide adenosyltransferase [Candidatus Saccharicenans sp.]